MSTAETPDSTVNASLSPLHPKVVLVPRPSDTRFGDNHGWLKTFHTFSFAMHYDPKYENWGSLRVLNEDRVEPNTGFGTHGHREFEIFSYVVSGELEHKDSMGNVEILKRGDLQLTHAGQGIRHSEKAHGPKQVHFLQIWALPPVRVSEPKYYTRHFTDDEKKDRWVRIVAPINASDVVDDREGQGPAPLHSPVTLYATLLSPSTGITHTFAKPLSGQSKRLGYAHVIQTSGYNTGKATGAMVQLNGGLKLAEGDGAFVEVEEEAKLEVKNVGDKVAEVLLFDVGY